MEDKKTHDCFFTMNLLRHSQSARSEIRRGAAVIRAVAARVCTIVALCCYLLCNNGPPLNYTQSTVAQTIQRWGSA